MSSSPTHHGSTMHPALAPLSTSIFHLSCRAIVAPMSRVSALPDGTPTAAMVDYYRSFATGGFGLVITEGTYPEARYGRAYDRQPGLCSAEHVAGWRPIVDAVHAAGAPMLAQLMHAGALSQCLTETRAPSAVTPKGTKMPAYGGDGPFPTPHAMSRDDIARTLDAFAAAARNAAHAGFDGVEIHGANGYLVDQFFTAELNERADEYGGSVAARAQFALDVLRAVRSSVPTAFVVGLRVSQGKVNDLGYRWTDGRAHARELFTALRRERLDFLHVASEGLPWNEDADLGDGITVTGVAREVLGVPVIANGGLHDPALAARVLVEGHADLIALGRGALANPDWPRRLAEGRPLARFDRAMLLPRADLASAAAWREAAMRPRGSLPA